MLTYKRKLSHVLNKFEHEFDSILFERTGDSNWTIQLKSKNDVRSITFYGYKSLKDGLFAVENLLNSRRK